MPIEFDCYKTYETLLNSYSSGIQDEDYNDLVEQYGKCNIVLPEKSIFTLLIESILSPFYIFQIFS